MDRSEHAERFKKKVSVPSIQSSVEEEYTKLPCDSQLLLSVEKGPHLW